MASCGRDDCEVRLWDLRQGFGSDQVVQLQHCKSDRPLNSVALRPSLTASEVANCCATGAGLPRTCDVVIGGGQDARDVAVSGAGAEGQFEPVLLRIGSGSELEEYDHEDKGKSAGHFGPIHTLALWSGGPHCVSGSEDGNVRIRDFGDAPAALPESPRQRPQPPPPQSAPPAAPKQAAEPKAKAKTAE